MEEEVKKTEARKRPTAKDTIAKLKARITELEGRVIQKERYLTSVEEDCDAKIANKDVIILGLQKNIEVLRSENLALRNKLDFAEKKLQGKKKINLFGWLKKN